MLTVFNMNVTPWLLLTAVGAGVLAVAARALGWLPGSVFRQRRPVPGWFWPVCAAGGMLALQTATMLRDGWPVPAVHDEFSNLLASDTFAHGRLTNPPPPVPEAFESWQILVQPTYQSKYPPGQGLALALGQVLTGQPVVGNWLCLAAAAAATVWMVTGWVGRRWAPWVVLILLSRWPITRMWGFLYFGGAVPWLGGALFWGALPRLRRRPDVWNALLLGLGLCVLSQSRPYEGGLAVLVGLVWWFAQLWAKPTRPTNPLIRTPRTSVWFALGSCLLALIGWMALYDWAVTGNPLTMPYQVYEATYTRRTTLFQTLFSWTELGDRPRTIPTLEYESSAAQRLIAERYPLTYAGWKAIRLGAFFLGPWWLIPAVCGWWSGQARGRLLTLSAIAVVLIAILLQRSAGWPHYGAPVMPLVVLLIIQGLRWLRVAGRKQLWLGQLPYGVGWAAAAFIVAGWCSGNLTLHVRPWSLDRAAIDNRLQTAGGQHLILVRYLPGHSMHEEWVYNQADLNTSSVIWARDLDEATTARVLAAFPGRTAWQLCPDENPATLKRYQTRASSRGLPKAHETRPAESASSRAPL